MAKKKRKKKNKVNKKKTISALLLFAIVAVVILVFLMYYPNLNRSYTALDQTISQTDEMFIDKVIYSDLDLLSLVEDNSTIISWESSDEDYIDKSGKVTRPSFSEGDKVVRLTATYSIPLKDMIAEILASTLGYNQKTKTYTVKVAHLDPTDSEKVELCTQSISFPKKLYGSINLPSYFNVFSDVSLSWESSNPSVFSNAGIFTAPSNDQEFELTLTATCNEATSSITFTSVAQANEISYEELNIDFNDLALTNRYQSFEYKGVNFTASRIEGESSSDNDASETGDYGLRHVTLRTNSDESSSIKTGLIENATSLSFTYCSTRTSGVKVSKLVVTITDLDKNVSTEEVIIVFDGASHEVKIDLDKDCYLQIDFETEYSEDKVSIDNLLITRELTIMDFINDVSSLIPTSTSDYLILPYTTSFGGSIEYSSSNPQVLSDDGVVVNPPLENTTVKLNVKVSHLFDEYNFEVEVVVKGTKETPNVEIHFIDIGKYGQSDCGESIYIKYENIDILIDAGDSFDASEKAVTEAINKYLTDGILDYVIATHPDSDHIGGMPNVFEQFQVENLIVFDGDHTSNKYTNFVNSYTNENCNVINIYDDIIMKNDVILSLGEDVYIEFINTMYYDEEVSEETNGRSIVFMLYAYDTKVLFTGDADSQGAHPDLEDNYQDKIKDIDILKVVHHGTREGTDDEFLQAVDPEVAIICNGNYLGNKHSHPHVETIENLYEYDPNMKVYAITGGSGSDGCELGSNGSYKCDSSDYMNDRNGTIDLIINNNGYEITCEYNPNPIEMKDTDWWKGYLDTVE